MDKINTILDQLEEMRNEMYQSKPLLFIDEIVVLTGLSKSSIYKLTSARKIPHFKSGKRLIFDRREIMDWLTSNRISTIEEIERRA